MFLKKMVEIDTFDRQKGGLFLGSDRSGPSDTIDDGHFAQKILGEQNCKHRLSGSPQVFDDLDRSPTDNKHPIARFAFPDNDIVLMKHRFFDSTRNFGQRGGSKSGKDRDGLQKLLTHSMHVQVGARSVSHEEIFTGPGRGSNEKSELRSQELQELQNRTSAFRSVHRITADAMGVVRLAGSGNLITPKASTRSLLNSCNS
jgi:hypothetical protein